jgi:hypothetical protein
MLATLNKTLDPADYGELGPELAVVDEAVRLTAGVGVLNHPHRRWEYAACLQALGHVEGAVLDVGGGGYILSAALALDGHDVTMIEPDEGHRRHVAEAARRLGRLIGFKAASLEDGVGRWGAVACVSVIEHVPDDAAFFAAACRAVLPGGVLFLTTDFHASGLPQCPHHLRTYNGAWLHHAADYTPGFGRMGHADYSDRGGHVNGYSFASVALRRVG